ncbi:MAG: hypothetical protein AAGC69_17000 [Paracraurococcus sp.]|jgi:hypothetical protein
MNASTVFFLVLSVLIAVAGLLAAGMAQDYLHVFGIGLFGFGVLFGYSCVKRHYDALEAARR